MIQLITGHVTGQRILATNECLVRDGDALATNIVNQKGRV